jgi:hypothetical protein
MNRTAFVTSEKKTDLPILVVDKEGNIGEALVKELKNESLVIYVSKKPPETLGNVVHVPFLRKIPTIPDNQYSHIFVVDENIELTTELIEEFFKKAEKDGSLLNLIIGLKSSTKKFINNHINIYAKAKIIVFGEIFKNDIIYDRNTNINKFILQANTKGRILIAGDGTKAIYPVYFDDLVQGILEAAFGADEGQKIIYLYPKHGITFLSLANILKKKNPDLKVDFIKEKIKEEESHLPVVEGNYLLGENYDIEDRIKKMEIGAGPKDNLDEVKQEKSEYKKESEKVYSFKTLFVLLIFLFLLPLISTAIFSLIGFSSLYTVKNSLDAGNLPLSKNFASLASGSFAIAQNSALVLTEEVGVVGQADRVSGLINSINSAENISISALSLIDASDKFKSILTGSSTNPEADFSNATVELKNALYLYNKEEQKGIIPQNITGKLGDSIRIVSSTIDLWHDIFGFSGSRTYFILFQNNMELRPGGGFIGSYAILTVNKGKIAGFNIYDVYDADGQLKGHIEPPYPVRRYLSTEHWFLRDSNFNVDFSKGAISSALFLNTEMHQSVDGIVGVDLSFVKSILSVLGPVKVSDYNQTVTVDNFYQITQAQTEKDFFPGSAQKKDFLSSLYNSLELKISEAKNIPYLSLIQAVTKAIYEKHILFAFNNASEQATFSVNGWSSALVDERPTSDSIINDFIGVDESNMGGNKVNYYVSRNMSQKTSIDDKGNINESLGLNIKNSSPTALNAAGIYKNYLRFILPLNANLLSVQIDGKEQKIVPAITDPAIYEKKGFVAPDGLEVQKEDQGPNTIYGFLVNVQPQETESIRIAYVLAQQINVAQPEIDYNLKVFKQPGVDSYNYDYSLDFPSSFKVLNASQDVKASENTTLLSTQITRDREVSVGLVAK